MKIYCQLKGSKFCDGQTILRNILSGGRPMQPSDLRLVRDHDCKQDRNCVQVRYRYGRQDVKIGNINKENAPLIASCMDNGGKAEVIGLNLCGSAETNVGLFFTVDAVNPQIR